ncbi:MAG: cytochrome C biogenesis protein [Chloroflexi bacterium HGW-Chloroflexi-3]|nr:MAG: cytochrome C biogenesis protein [Chloroflexi bacterium HGW-Chloroflexi-3]
MNLNTVTDFKIEVYLPAEYLESIRLALTAAQAGFVGNYDNVFATTQVTGHWRPLPGSDPYQGNIGEMETAPEIKLEVNCKKEHVSTTLQAIRAAHPYEEPLIRVIPILNQYFE